MHTHRHIVAFPLFALAIVGLMSMGKGSTFLSSIEPTIYETVDAKKEDRIVTIPHSEARVVVFKGATLEIWNGRAVLRDGSVLAGSQGLTEITADRATIKGIRGAFHVTLRNGSLMVAAITTPVSVRVGAQSVAIPIGYQWRSGTSELSGREDGWQKWLTDRKPMLAPRTFVRSMAEQWGTLPSADGALQAGDSGSFWSMPFQFAAAQERNFSRWSSNVLDHLTALSRTGDTAGLEAMLSRVDVEQVLNHLDTPSAMAATLLGNTEVPAIRTEVMPMLHDDVDVVMIAALHPELRSAAWTQAPTVNVQVDGDLLRLTALPLTDAGKEPISELLLSQWEDEFRSALDQLTDDKGTFLAAYLPVIAQVSQMFAQTGYPERAEHYRDFLLDIGATYHDQLLPETRVFLDAIAHLDIADVLTPALQDTQNLSDVQVLKKPEPIAPEVSEKLRVDARQKLGEAGAVFSTQTGITPVSPRMVKVTDIIFATATQDRNLTFFWDMEKDEISSVTTGGKVLPFPLSFEQFIQWARGL